MIRLKNPKSTKRFQKTHGLKVTGHLDKQTNRKVRIHNRNARSSSSPARSQPKQPRDPLQHAANMQAVAEYAPQIRQAQGQIAVSGEQLNRTGNWYQDYINKVDQARQQTADAWSNAENNLIRQSGQSDTADRAAQEQINQRMAADAATRGAQVDPSIAATANQAASSRQAAISTMLANLGTQAASSTEAFAGRGVVAQGARAQALTAETNRGRNLRTALGQLKSERTAKAATYRSALAKDQLNSQIAEQELGIKVGQLGVNRQNAATSSLAASSLSKNRGKTAKETHRHNVAGETTAEKNARIADYKAHHPSKGKGTNNGPTHAAKVKGQVQFSKAQNLLTGKFGSKKNFDQQKAVNGLLAAGITDPAIALAAVQQHKFGGVGPHTRKVLKKRYRLKTHGFPNAPTVSAPTSPAASGAP